MRFTSGQVQLARAYSEQGAVPLAGELKVLLYGDARTPEEHWCLIRSAEESQYWVSDLGHFAVWRRRPSRLWFRGYWQAVVYANGKKVPRAVHVEVANAFLPRNRNGEGRVVRHLNSNRHENHVNNLLPGTQAENMRDRHQPVPVISPPGKEEWRLSQDYAGVRVSNLGCMTQEWWVLFNTSGSMYLTGPRAGSKKHVSVVIALGSGRRKYELLHRLVYEAFKGSIPEGKVVRHLNDDPHDNRASNLQLGTHKDNAADRRRNGRQLRGANHPNSKYSLSQKLQVKDCLERGISQASTSRETGVLRSTVWQISKMSKRQIVNAFRE